MNEIRSIDISSSELINNREYIDKIKALNLIFKEKEGHWPRVTIKTYGCQMNEHDSENLIGMLSLMGYEETEDEKDANLVIFNTCCIRENAELRVYGNLGQLKTLKKKKPSLQIAVCGCMMQREEIVSELKKKFPFVNLIFGTHNIYNFPSLLYKSTLGLKKKIDTESLIRYDEEGNLKKKKKFKLKTLVEIWDIDGNVVEGLPSKRKYDTKAFVNIMYGCNNFCTYCIVPYTRGRERSRTMENIRDEVIELVSNGVKEVTLLGQNVNSYGDGKYDFADLLLEINKIEGLSRIRFMTSHPKDISYKLIDRMAELDKVCEFLHLPIQSGSNAVLKRMNRNYTKEKYLDIIHYAKERIPGLTVSTDLIVGFPGETEEDAAETLDLIKRVEYDSAYTFIYSRRKGTPADKYQNQIPEEVKHARFSVLLEEMNKIIIEKNKTKVGKVYEVLVEGKSKTNDEYLTGRSRNFDSINFKGDESMIGELVLVKITDPKNFSLVGEVVNN